MLPLDLPGWRDLVEDLVEMSAATPGGTEGHDCGHVPLRWRVVVAARDAGVQWRDIAAVMGVSPQAAWQQYQTWKPRMCCPREDQR